MSVKNTTKYYKINIENGETKMENTTHEQRTLKDTIKTELQDLHALNNSMITDDIHEVPRFTDGTPITTVDLADMNINALDNIAELLGIELEE